MLRTAEIWSHCVNDLLHMGDAVRISDYSASGSTRAQSLALGSKFCYAGCVEDGSTDAVAVE